FGSYVMAIGLSLQKSDLGLPFPVMNNNMFSFFESILSWENEEGGFPLEEGKKSGCGELFSDLRILIFEWKMCDFSRVWGSML
ncbi:hypothetical protein KI387_042124, partial [Taxus chinensis]